MELGEAIKALRKQRGWTQGDLAKEVGISQQFLSQVEKGKRGLHSSILEKIYSVFSANGNLPELLFLTLSVKKGTKSKWMNTIISETQKEILKP